MTLMGHWVPRLETISYDMLDLSVELMVVNGRATATASETFLGSAFSMRLKGRTSGVLLILHIVCTHRCG